ncbi:MAG: endonuclease/exonuclease/phosphatase family protein [Paracoccaceae bacterium]|nr:endonuclease/exonuclease/phosphatase family protein [Paracoccaceae bacterium]
MVGILVLGGVTLALGFAGRFHGLGDSLSLFRPVLVPLVGLVSLALLMSGPRRLALAGVALAAGAGLSLAPPAPVSALPDTARVYGFYQKNLLWHRPHPRDVAADIRATGADFVALQEVHRFSRPILEDLGDSHPAQLVCPFAAVGGVAVLSRWPMIEGQTLCAEGQGVAGMQVATPDGPLWVLSVHLHWPFPYGQARQVEALIPELSALEGPVAVGGDFNMVAWSHAVLAIARATGTANAGYAGGTLALSFRLFGTDLAVTAPRLPIDHVLIPRDATALSVDRRGLLGSDHHGVWAEFALPPRS